MLSLTGVLVAAFVPTFLKHVHTSKLAEAALLLDSMHRHAASYYESEHTIAGKLQRGCLPAGAGPFPLEPSALPVQVDFQADESGAASWRALGLTQVQALRYSYQLVVPEPGCSVGRTRPAITFQARGDLDGDGTQSLLERASAVEGSVEPTKLVPQGPLRIVNRIE
ncbi:MAG: hypothetical protein JWN48_1542 [Myxococcaceae bacterium]|nr:hypothetical protein [Myxococcaceae bacterium]